MADQKEFTPEQHRAMAVKLFNSTWDLIEKEDRTPLEDDRMIHGAHASRYHWGQVGTVLNLARGEWQISRVYAILGRAEPALYHGQRLLDYCKADDIGDSDLAFAYEAITRAHAITGDEMQRAENIALAREAGEAIAKKGDRDYFFTELNSIP